LLEDTELGDALRKLTALVSSGSVNIGVEVIGTPVSLPSTTKHHLLRVAQEATTNGVRHAHAQNISIQLEYRAEAVMLAVIDDGVGFRPDDVLSKGAGHFGLRGLRARARKIKGELHIASAPGQGTAVRVTVPLTADQPVSPDATVRAI
jgi:signal transduction histidine kinase